VQSKRELFRVLLIDLDLMPGFSLVEKRNFVEDQFLKADVNGDGTIDFAEVEWRSRTRAPSQAVHSFGERALPTRSGGRRRAVLCVLHHDAQHV
jgi:hypothetical protein